MSSSTRAFKHPARVRCAVNQLIDVIHRSIETRRLRDQAHRARSGVLLHFPLRTMICKYLVVSGAIRLLAFMMREIMIR